MGQKKSNDYSHYEEYEEIGDAIPTNPSALVIYKKQGSKKGIWNCRVRVPGSKKYVNQTTRMTHKAQAKVAAIRFYKERQTLFDLGVDVAVGSFADVYEKWVQAKGIKKSKARLKSLQALASRYFIPYFSTHLNQKNFSKITQKNVEDYFDWRLNYWISGDGAKIKAAYEKYKKSGKKNPKLGNKFTGIHNASTNPSPKTWSYECSHLREIFRWGYNEGKHPKLLDVDTTEVIANATKTRKKYGGKAQGRRGDFPRDDYRRLIKYLNRWCEGRGDLTLPASQGGFTDNNWKKQHLEQRKLLRDKVLFMAHTGVRPGEIERILWCDVKKQTHRQTKQTVNYVVVNVNERNETGKTGERNVVLRPEAIDVLDRIKIESAHTKKSDLVFCNVDGNSVPGQGRTFIALLDRLGMRHNDKGEPCSLYSLRHTFATQRLEWSTKGDEFSWSYLSEQMGSSEKNLRERYTHPDILDKPEMVTGNRKPKKRKGGKVATVTDLATRRMK